MLQSPHFLYRLELAAPVGAAPRRLSGFELASRLSYLRLGSMPDDALLSAAESGQLDTNEGVAAQAARLLDDPRAKQAVGSFFTQWLELDKLERVEKDPSMFPRFTPQSESCCAKRPSTSSAMRRSRTLLV